MLDAGFEQAEIFHLGYVVPNMDRAIKYWSISGARLIVPPALDPIQNVFCALLTYKGAAAIELIAPNLVGPHPLGSRLAKGGGLDHVCFFCDDVASATNTLRDEGGVVAVEPTYGAVFDRELSFVVNRAGLLVEVMSRKPSARVPVDPLAHWLQS
jgi:hypothetical protein